MAEEIKVFAGSNIVLKAKIRDAHQHLTDPWYHEVYILTPLGEMYGTIYKPVRIDRGEYEVRFVVPREYEPGVWRLAWKAVTVDREEIYSEIPFAVAKGAVSLEAPIVIQLELYAPQKLPAIYLVPPHARLIAEKTKTLIVKSKRFEKYTNQPIYFMEDNQVFGILKITKVDGPLPVYNVLIDLAEKHRISPEEWEEWWPDVTEVYCYEFTLVEVFDRPKYFEKPPGVQTFIREVELSEETPTIVTQKNYETYLEKLSTTADTLQLTHSRFKCMRCSEPPTKDVLYAEGMGRAWFCDKHFEEWKKEPGGPWEKTDPQYDPNYTHEKDINKVYIVNGEVPVHWKEHYRKGSKRYKLTNEIIDYETYMKEFNIDKPLQPQFLSKPVLLHHHAKTHAWFNRAKEGKSKFTKEQIVKYHGMLVKEMLRRHLNHHITDDLDSKVKHEELLPVSPSGVEMGEEILLEEVLDIFSKPFYMKRPLVFIVGGLVSRGRTKDDIDLLIDYEERIDKRDTALEFRLGRALADAGERFNGRFKFMYRGDREGPFTNHVHLYDLICVPSQFRSVVKMEKFYGWLQNQLAIADIKDARAKREAEKSRQHDEISPMKFFLVCKPQIGHAPAEKYTFESLFTIVKDEHFPFSVEKKYDGVVLVFFKEGDSICIRTEKGIDVTDMLPETVKELKTFPHTFTMVSDSEMWIKGQYVGREFVGTYLMSKRKPDDSKLVHNVFDVLYFYDSTKTSKNVDATQGDLHKLPYETRHKYMELMPFDYSTITAPSVDKGHFNKVPLFIAENRKELETLCHKLSKAPSSEGVVIKSLKGTHPLTGFCRTWYKMKITTDIEAIILKINTTKRPNVFTYRTGVSIPKSWKATRTVTVGNREYLDLGKTLKTVNRYKVGDVVLLNLEELFYYKDPETDEVQLVAYVSQVLKKSTRATPFTAEEAIIAAEHDKTLRKKTEALTYTSMEMEQFAHS